MKMNRLCIYLLSDKGGIVDDYILYMLKCLKKVANNIVVVSNGKLEKNSLFRLQAYSKNIYERKNKGFDAGGFKDAIINYLSIKKVQQYDELIIINDSFFGPFDSFEHVFAEMDKRNDLDFWSLTKNMGNYECAPCMQTYFVNFRKKILHSYAFEEYWRRLPYYTEFRDVVEQYEKKIAKFFEDKGFTWDSYVKNDKYDCVDERYFYFSVYHSEQYEIMREQKYPVLKRKLLAFDAMDSDYGMDRQGRENIIESLEYIEQETDYDISLIWKNVLRVYNLRNIQDSCCLRFIPTKSPDESVCTKNLVCIWYEGIDETFQIKEKLPKLLERTDVIIISTNELKFMNVCEKTKNIKIKNAKNVWDAVIKANLNFENYDYVGVLTEENVCASNLEPYSVKSGASWTKWENLVGNGDYIGKSIEIFRKHKDLGLLVTQRPIFAKYFANEGISERISSQNKEFFQLAEVLGISNFLDVEKELADYSDSFWCRGDILIDFINELKKVCNYDFTGRTMNKLMPYYIQSKGYYTAIVESEKSAAITETICINYLRDIIFNNKKNYMFSTYQEMKSHMSNSIKNISDIKQFIYQHSKVGIYGTGKIAKQLVLFDDVRDFYCFIVSDGETKRTFINDKMVFWTSEMDGEGIDGIIIALNKTNTYKSLMTLGKVGYNKDIVFVER